MNPFEQDLRGELRNIADAITITSQTSFVFSDLPEVTVEWNSAKTDSQTSRNEEHQNEEVSQRLALAETLSDMIYWNCYAQRFGAQPARPLGPLDIPPNAEFHQALSAANQSKSRWDQGWKVVQRGIDGEVQVRKGECHRTPEPGEFLFEDRPGVRPEPGDPVSIRVVRESVLLQYGFYFCFSEQIPDQFEEFNSVRVYFNLRPSGAPALLQELSGRLNRFQVPFRFKCPVSPSLFDRRDAGVLYVPWRYFEITRRCVSDSLPQVESFLDDDVPLFTKRVHPGVGMAEDPGQQQSFGQIRCRLMAEALVQDWHARQSDSVNSSPEASIEQRFQRVGLSLDRPWLNPGSRDWLKLRPVQVSVSETAIAEQHRIPSLSDVDASREETVPGHGDETYLQTADRIGSRLCRDAVWSGDLCNWLEWDAEPFGTTWQPVHRTMGPSPVFPGMGVSLYGGSAGIMLFLARLYQFTREPLHRETAVAAAKQVLNQVSLLSNRVAENGSNTAFYTGWLSAAWALAEIGHETGDDALVEAALLNVANVANAQPAVPHSDIISGSAGLICMLVSLSLKFEKPEFLDVALRHGEFLLKSAAKSDQGWSWKTIDNPVHQNLTGYGHGVSGITCALAELYRITRDERFAAAVHEGLRYETNTFSADEGNWHDHRINATDDERSIFMVGWCHGAAGIGMARFRLLELGFDTASIRSDLETATQTTLARLSYSDGLEGLHEFCLCHGLGGNSELPLLLSERDAPPVHVNRQQLILKVDLVARAGIELFEETGIPWPCNRASTGESPQMFNGLAGVGYFYLRAFAPAQVPSVLLLRPEHES